jgi:hypothetical protein
MYVYYRQYKVFHVDISRILDQRAYTGGGRSHNGQITARLDSYNLTVFRRRSS